MIKHVVGRFLVAFLFLVVAEVVGAQILVATDDDYTAAEGQILQVENPGVLENDTLDGGELPPTAEAVLLSTVTHGFLDCEPDPGVVELCADGSFDYTPDAAFVGIDSFTYWVVYDSNVSNVATVTITVSGCEPVSIAGPPAIDGYSCWIESSYQAKLAQLGYGSFQEGFENEAVWGPARQPNTQPAVMSQGVNWTPNNAISGITTGNGAARTGAWGFYELPHGDPTGGLTDPLRDGFMGTWTGMGALVGVGGWLTSNTGGGAQAMFSLDGVETGFPNPNILNSFLFFGVIDVTGFTVFEVFETEGVVEDQKFIFADDFTLALGGVLPIFADGFESGDTSAWSVQFP